MKSRFGKVICYDRKGQLYCNADDAIVLFHIEGGLQTGVGGQKLFRFNSVKETAPPVEKPKEVKKPKKTKTDIEKPFEEPKADEPTTESNPAEETSEPAEKVQPQEKVQPEEKVQPQEKVRPVEEDSIKQPETAEEASA